MSIEVQSVSKSFGLQKALDEVSFSISGGEVVGFLGPNGAGKTTMMKILTCFMPPGSGRASVLGFDVMEQSMEVRKRIGYLPETNPLYPEMYVREYLGFVAGIHKLDNHRQRIEAVIGLTGLGKEQHKKIGALSKGYRQRTGLAQVLLHDPEVLILDEPTSGLDPNQLLEIRNLISAVGREKTVMLSTHIMQEVEAVCDRVIIIDRGKIVADAATSELGRMSFNRQVILLELDQEVQADQLSAIPGISRVEALGDMKWKLESGTPADIRPELFAFAVSNGLTILSLSREAHSLEEVFRRLTGNTPAD
ncbi:MAG TPA: gliding motility-associated ABC transporter ATP-binding subunit GldA [Bacteroidales bacterium]|nr:gliding motility-associated ABC transporter ATP-binding subunit GldA [Bacteroidales bacterium]HSA43462.1 gliding motility-associated ABC transporter ATP-binding subunit GldA [Bacteroidales bacterium]